MFAQPHIPVPPPGQERKYPDPDKHDKIPFTYAAAAIEGETAYWIWGDFSSNKLPLIVLHGGAGMPHSYMLPISLVSLDFGTPVVMYDQIGCGESTRFRERKGDETTWTPELFIAELENVIAALGIKQFDLMGHSWGAALAGVFAIRKQPPGLRKLIICNTPTDLVRLAESSAHLRKQMPSGVQEVLNRCERDDDFSCEDGMQALTYAYTLHGCRVQPWPKELLDGLAAVQEDNTVYSTISGSSALTMNGSLSKMPGFVENRSTEITEQTCQGGMLVTSLQYDLGMEDTITGWFTLPQCKVKWVRFALSSHFGMLEETEALVNAIGVFLTEN
jgi:L-proline amide hydrolase